MQILYLIWTEKHGSERVYPGVFRHSVVTWCHVCKFHVHLSDLFIFRRRVGHALRYGFSHRLRQISLVCPKLLGGGDHINLYKIFNIPAVGHQYQFPLSSPGTIFTKLQAVRLFHSVKSSSFYLSFTSHKVMLIRPLVSLTWQILSTDAQILSTLLQQCAENCVCMQVLWGGLCTISLMVSWGFLATS